MKKPEYKINYMSLNVHLPVEQKNLLEQVARQKGTSVSKVISVAIEKQFGDTVIKHKQKSVVQKIKAKAPVSKNPRHSPEKKANIANNLIFLRRVYALSRVDLAKAINSDVKTVREWEKQIFVPSEEKLHLILSYFNITKEDLFEKDLSSEVQDDE